METSNPVEWTVEENFKFRLSHMKEKLLEWASQPNGTMSIVLQSMHTLWYCYTSNCSQVGQGTCAILD